MFRNWFSKKSPNANGTHESLPFVDLEGQPLHEGDWVEALRYDLGTCQIIRGEQGWEYESLDSGKRVSYVRMIDAATKHQKVRKKESRG